MRRNIVEWIVLGVSLAGIVLLVGVLVVEGLSEDRPASPTAELHPDRAYQGALGWIVPVTITNDGDQAAEAVVVEAEAAVGEQVETRALEIDFLPAGTAVEGAFSFSAAPTGEITVRLVGFRDP